eukprot:gb/GEZN01002570.1/.p1 GENE.gb/GEZN01002570.1/~~gb/GEZN01002570.1/.p1  ORF type:complete len:584 (-),score=61.07 gb/GEZN01002570.1/:571-2322(-)
MASENSQAPSWFVPLTAAAAATLVAYKFATAAWERSEALALSVGPKALDKKIKEFQQHKNNFVNGSIVRPWDSRENKRPWQKWPKELPACNQAFQDTAEWKFLNDYTYLAAMHHKIRMRAFDEARTKLTPLKHAAVLVQGGTSAMFDLYDTDCDKCVFRQEAYFLYLFGVVLPDCFGVMDLDKQQTLLFVPPVTYDSQRWMGEKRPLSWYNKRYLVDEVFETGDLAKILKEKGIEHLHTLQGINSDSDLPTSLSPDFPGIDEFKKHDKLLYNFLTELRVIKTPQEVDYLRVSSRVSSQAHVYVMRHVKPGMNERHLEAMFKAYTAYFGGSRHMAYTCICASGANGAILHYGWAGRPNNRTLVHGDMAVLDMGAEYNGYCTDITRSYPVNGKFTANQKLIYEAVLDAQETVLRAMKPGVRWTAMHCLAERVIIERLIQIGILVGGTLNELDEAGLGSVFMPHGLGHFLGLNTHDVGGYTPEAPIRPTRPGIKYLRTQRTLEAGMVITVEPGIYFNDPTLDEALKNPNQARFIDTKVLDQFRGTGGVRIEDDVVVTSTGCENFTMIPVEVNEIEALISEAQANSE